MLDLEQNVCAALGLEKLQESQMKRHRCPDCGGPLVYGEGCACCPVCGLTLSSIGVQGANARRAVQAHSFSSTSVQGAATRRAVRGH